MAVNIPCQLIAKGQTVLTLLCMVIIENPTTALERTLFCSTTAVMVPFIHPHRQKPEWGHVILILMLIRMLQFIAELPTLLLVSKSLPRSVPQFPQIWTQNLTWIHLPFKFKRRAHKVWDNICQPLVSYYATFSFNVFPAELNPCKYTILAE